MWPRRRRLPWPTTEEQKTVYALGLLLSQSLQTFELKPEELALSRRASAMA